MNRKPLRIVAAATLALAALSGCSAADRASSNLSTASDNFEVERRIVFVNGITDKYLLEIQGKCSITADGEDSQLEVTCKTGPETFKKHYLGLSDNVTYFVEQTDAVPADEFRYRVIFRPEAIIPAPELDTSAA